MIIKKRLCTFVQRRFFMLLNIFLENRSVCTDTRKIKAGDIFFSLKGVNFDGNVYAEVALEKGASYAVIDNPTYAISEKYIVVDDALKALQELATAYRRHLGIPIIALTGSNGKTTTKELIAAVLETKYKIQYTEGNLNNHIGVPLTLLSITPHHEMAVVEMGANHQGEINELCEIAEPNFGLITNIGKAHLEGFGGIEGVKKGKSEMYRFIAKTRGQLFCNEEDEVLKSLLPADAKVLFYKFPGEILRSKGGFLAFQIDLTPYTTNLIGDFNSSNIAVAIAIGNYFDINNDDAAKAVCNYQPNNNRSQKVMLGVHTIIKDSYNSNPSSLRTSLQDLINTVDNKELILIIGDMLEMGEYAAEEHNSILTWLDQYEVRQKIFVGTEFLKCKGTHSGLFYSNTQEATQNFDLDLKENPATIFLKGSRGIAVEKILDCL